MHGRFLLLFSFRLTSSFRSLSFLPSSIFYPCMLCLPFSSSFSFPIFLFTIFSFTSTLPFFLSSPFPSPFPFILFNPLVFLPIPVYPVSLPSSLLFASLSLLSFLFHTFPHLLPLPSPPCYMLPVPCDLLKKSAVRTYTKIGPQVSVRRQVREISRLLVNSFFSSILFSPSSIVCL